MKVGTVCDKHPELQGLRYSSGHCKSCHREYGSKWQRENKDRHLTHARAHEARNKERRAAGKRAWYEKNKEWVKQNVAAWRENNKSRSNANAALQWTQRYRLMGGQALAKTYAKQIVAIYENCPEGLEVDHIIPLRAKGVCGLHVPWNLQYLTPAENRSKGARWQE